MAKSKDTSKVMMKYLDPLADLDLNEDNLLDDSKNEFIKRFKKSWSGGEDISKEEYQKFCEESFSEFAF